MDLALYSEGAISYSEIVQMPLSKIKIFEKRLAEKHEKSSGKHQEML